MKIYESEPATNCKFNEEKWLQENAAKILKGQAGNIKECPGCCETIDGHNSLGHPISSTFNCLVGAGCDECDDTGVVIWDYTDYPAYHENLKLKETLKEIAKYETCWKCEHYIGNPCGDYCKPPKPCNLKTRDQFKPTENSKILALKALGKL